MTHINILSPSTITKATVPFNALDSLRTVLEELGFAIVTDVLTAAEVTQAEQLFASDLRSIIALDDDVFRKHPLAPTDIVAKWPLQDIPLGRVQPNFASDYGIPQGRCAWFPSVYQNIFGEGSKLCCGMDNVFFNNKDVRQPEEERVDRLWPHADQSKNVRGSGQWECFQGVVYLWPATSETSSTIVWPASHRTIYHEMMEIRAYGHHFCPLPPCFTENFVSDAGRVPVPSGALLLWNSRTVHQGWSLGRRLAVPVCFEPVQRRDEEALERKIECAKTGRPTTHWASLGIPHRVADLSDGGTKKLPVKTLAHKWLLHADGVTLRPEILELL
jgi:hypothetical protein